MGLDLEVDLRSLAKKFFDSDLVFDLHASDALDFKNVKETDKR